jgi:hypothetical protein
MAGGALPPGHFQAWPAGPDFGEHGWISTRARCGCLGTAGTAGVSAFLKFNF